jgi:DNA-directed RNA polymerase subunit RPC12/RpoP
MTSPIEYKCPSCGGGITFDSSQQRMKCPYCGKLFDIQTLEDFNSQLSNELGDDMNWENSAGSEWTEEETDGLKSYVCKSCGGEIVSDENTAATSCPFCGNPVVMSDKFSGSLKPDLIIPFKLNKEDAKKALNKHYMNKKLLPKVFKSKNHIDEVKGVYVPFWLFDSGAYANIRYKASKVRTWSDSKYEYTETSFFSCFRSGSLRFENVPVDGSSKMPDDLMESIEPFNMSDAVGFNTAYLSGYLADKYDVDETQSIERANKRIKKSVESAFEDSVIGYTTVNPESSNVRLSESKVKYALYPVWILNTTYKKKKYTFAMNGQTGKIVGDLPLDKAAYNRWFWLLTAFSGAAAYLATYLIWLWLL